MSILEHEDLNEAIVAYLMAHDLGKVAETMNNEIKGMASSLSQVHA